MKVKALLLRGSFLVLFALMSYGTYQLWCINRSYAQEADMHSQMLEYRPVLQASAPVANNVPIVAFANTATALPESDDLATVAVNQSIVDLQAEYPDTLGWLTVPNTRIDYPFAQGNDNEQYLHMDLEQNISGAGTLFIDYRNSNDFSDFNTIFFGHHMKNGSMFGTLGNFNDRSFFDSNKSGMLFLRDKTYELEFFAFAVTSPDDAVIYNPYAANESEKIELLDHIRDSARYYRDIGVTADDRLVTLSTCNYEFEDARMIVVGRIV